MKQPYKRIHLVSPPYACGVAWLVNALQALDVRTCNANFHPHWIEEAGRFHITEQAAAHLKWHLPILHEKSSFLFHEDIEVVWEHRMDFANHDDSPVILFVRDPRDAIYSMYLRNYAQECSFDDFLDRADTWPDHFPGLFQLPAFSTFAYFCEFWLAMGRRLPFLLVHFEDVKTKPFDVLSSVLAFIGVNRTSDAIRYACLSSGFDNAKKAMQQMMQATGETFATARAGKVNEWEVVYTPSQLDKFSPDCRSISQLFGYKGDFPSYVLPRSLDETLLLFVSENVNFLARGWISDCVSGKSYQPSEVIASFNRFSINKDELIQCGLILRALYYVRCIFSRLDSGAAHAAIACFIYLNLRWADQPHIRNTGLFSLRYLHDSASGNSQWFRDLI